ncbi:MAG: alpha/beta fold hydrolase [Gammaproteobacteria bacterium]|nr:alpha/beta fold hydrolase [Gammaproteobacteria bacterium]
MRDAYLHAVRACAILVLSLLVARAFGADSSETAGAKPHAIIVERLDLEDRKRQKQLPLRIAWPAAGGPYPVIVFSHGGGSSRDMYDRLADHWAAAGYVVFLPTHMESRVYGFDVRGAAPDVIVKVLESRRQDLSFILDSLGELPARIPELAGRIDAERVIAAGHSMGGATALTVTGLVMESPDGKERFGYRDERFDALILLTEPGNSPMAPVDPWRAIPIPVLVATGSKDYSGQWSGPPKRRFYGFAADTVFPADVPRHYLFIDNMDHYLGGAVCRPDVPGPPDYDAVRIINEVSTAFLDAYAKDQPEALEKFEGGAIAALSSGRATLAAR